ncbi:MULTISPECIES: hypothetical protein [Streptomyces]|uniref:hypothetical protein n=1 Tax=Streptomyces TaxID=1883 RepID=UPI0004C98475|nr:MULTISPECIES: hypothetical protein [unclassified Streptomyces]KJY20642.1 hypothetical protein VR43_14610 [Streptomyces sp. NRRL S-104]
MTPVPPVWFRLPPGFHDIAPSDREALDTTAEALESADARSELSRLMDGLDDLKGHDVVHTSIGLHPEDPTGVATSLFSLTVRAAAQPNPRLTVARAALGIARSPLWTSSTRRFIELPSGLPCSLVAGIISLPGVEHRLFQARIATVHTDGLHLLVLDLTSACAQHADAYTEILEAVAHTIRFSDPDPKAATPEGTSRILEVLL